MRRGGRVEEERVGGVGGIKEVKRKKTNGGVKEKGTEERVKKR